MRVSKNWVKFNKMFTLSPWVHARPDNGLFPIGTGGALDRLDDTNTQGGIALC